MTYTQPGLVTASPCHITIATLTPPPRDDQRIQLQTTDFRGADGGRVSERGLGRVLQLPDRRGCRLRHLRPRQLPDQVRGAGRGVPDLATEVEVAQRGHLLPPLSHNRDLGPNMFLSGNSSKECR